MAQFNSKAVVTITCGTTDAVVRYTLDGSSPSGSVGTQYSAPFTLYNNATVKAIGIKSGLLDSDIASYDIAIKLPNKSDMFNYGQSQITGDRGAFAWAETEFQTEYADYDTSTLTVRYTLDGSEPTETSPKAEKNVPINIEGNCTIKWKVFGTKNVASDTLSQTITSLKVQTPVISAT